MKAMILAAGLGTRMRPLTDHCPKPLLPVGKRKLIEYHLEALQAAGFKEVLINTHWLGEQVPQTLGDGSRWGLQLHYRHETELLETAGGIRNALDFLDSPENEPFLVLNGDVYCELDLAVWLKPAMAAMAQGQICLGLVANPEHNPKGDFRYGPKSNVLTNVLDCAEQCMTYAGIALFRPSVFCGLAKGPAALGPLLRAEAEQGRLRGLPLNCYWADIGTPERLEQLRARLA